MDNAELKALNEEYDEIVGEDGIIETSQDNVGENMPNALRYYFFMGQDDDFFYAAAEKWSEYDYEFTEDGYLTYDSTAFARNIQEAIDEGKKATYLYNQEEQDYFKGFVEDVDGLGEARTRGHFITRIGAMSESDFDTMEAYWSNTLENYSVTEEESGLPAWAWALIGVGIGIVVVGAGLAVFFILRAKKNKEGGSDEPKMYVDTTDDRSVDVYADDLADESDAPAAPAGEAAVGENASAEAPAEAEEIPAAPTGEVAAPDEEGVEAEETDGDKDLDSDDEAAAPAEAEEIPAAPTGEAAAESEEEKN